MTISQANKKKWNDTLKKLKQQLNLSDEEITTIKEWGVASLVTGISFWILFRIVQKLFGSSKKKVEINVEQPKDSSPKNTPPPAKKSPPKNPLYTSSPWFPFIKKYTGPLLVLIAKQMVNRYLRSNKIIR